MHDPSKVEIHRFWDGSAKSVNFGESAFRLRWRMDWRAYLADILSLGL